MSLAHVINIDIITKDFLQISQKLKLFADYIFIFICIIFILCYIILLYFLVKRIL